MFYMRELPSRDLIDSVASSHPELDPTAVEACYFLLRTGSDVLTAFDENLSRHRMSQSRFIVLLLLNRLELVDKPEEMSPSSLAEWAGVSRGTMTGLLDGLERDELIDRLVHNGDRRKFSIRMTEKGKETLDRIFPDYYKRIGGLMADLNEEERKTLVALLTKVNQGIPALLKP